MATKKTAPTSVNTSALSAIKGNQLYKLGDVKVGSPVFPIEWAHLGTPQNKNPEYDGKYGKYRFDLVIDPETAEGKAFIAKLEAAHTHLIGLAQQWATATKTKVKFTEELNLKKQVRKEGDEKVETGKLVLKFSQNAARLDSKTEEVIETPPSVVDVSGKPVPRAILNTIGNGTEVQVAFDFSPYYMNGALGTTAKLKRVRLVTLSRYGDDIKEDDYFDEIVTSGFVVDASDLSATADVGDDDAPDTDGDF